MGGSRPGHALELGIQRYTEKGLANITDCWQSASVMPLVLCKMGHQLLNFGPVERTGLELAFCATSTRDMVEWTNHSGKAHRRDK